MQRKLFLSSRSRILLQIPILALILAFAGWGSNAFGQTVTTDKADYYPGEYVTISGTGWYPGSTVTLVIEHFLDGHPDETLYALVGEDKTFSTSEYLIGPDEFTEFFSLTATGLNADGELVSQNTYFTDSPKIASVEIGPQQGILSPGTAGSVTFTITVYRATSNASFDANVCIYPSFPTGITYSFSPASDGPAGNQEGILSFATGQASQSGILTVYNDGSVTNGSWSFAVKTYAFPDNLNTIHSCSNPTGDNATALIDGELKIGLKPAIICIDDVVQDTDPGLCSAVVNYNITAEGDPIPDFTFVFEGASTGSGSGTGTGEMFNKGTTFVSVTASNGIGDPDVCEFEVIVQDGEVPKLTTPANDLTVPCNGSGNLAELDNWLTTHGGAIATDNCDTELTWSHNFTELSDLCGATGFAKVVFTATDDDDNSITTSATFTIEDKTPPVIETQSSSKTVECDGHGNIEELTEWLDQHGGAVASDVCGGVKWSHDLIALSDDCGATGSADVTFIATDDCENWSFTEATFTIVDKTPPVIGTESSNKTVECDGSGNTDELEAWLLSNGGATATDVCGGVTWSHNFTSLSDDCGATGSAEVTFTAMDDCGNTSTTIATFTIEDTTPPVIGTVAVDQTVECDGAGNAADLAEWLESNGGADATDVCGGVTWSNDFTELSDGCGATGSVLVTFTATDDCGNPTTTQATFTIEDTTPPVIGTVAVDQTVECDGAGNAADLAEWLESNGGADATDVCGGVTWSNDFTELSDGCGATGSVLVTFTATDDCGNPTTTQATFTIEDTTPPVIGTVAVDQTVECDGAGNAADLAEWLESNGGADATDVCGGVAWSNDFTGLSDGCGATGSVLVTFTATDDCGNPTTTQATFTIEDTTPPVIGTVAIDQTVECDGSGNNVELKSWLLSNGGAFATDVCGGVTWSNDFTELSDGCGATGSVLVTFTATDDCGNPTTTQATFTIEDTTPPVIGTVAVDQTVECDGAGNAADLAEWLESNGGADGTDACGGVTWSNDFVELTDECGATGSALVTFTATDDCGKASTTTATFTIVDTKAPIVSSPVSCGGSTTLETEPGECSLIAETNLDVTANDACSGLVVPTWTITGASGSLSGTGSLAGVVFKPGTSTVTWTALDDCGNSSTCVFDVLVKIATKTTVGVSGPYALFMDKITFFADVVTNCTGFPLRGTVEFFLDGDPLLPIGTASVFEIPTGEPGAPFTVRATLIHQLIEYPKLSNPDDPDSAVPYNVTAEFTPDPVESPYYLPSDDLDGKPLTIRPRKATPFDASGFYTGDEIAWTTGPNSSTGTLTMTALIKDAIPGGDVRGARVTFYLVNGSSRTPIPSAQHLPVNLIDMTDGSVGTASAIVQLNIGNATSQTYQIAVGISRAYYNNPFDAEAIAFVTVVKPGIGGRIFGDGELCTTGSAGLIKSAPGTSTSFYFDVNYNKSLSNPQGKVTLWIQSMYNASGILDRNADDSPHSYIITSNAIALLSIKGLTAQFSSKANLVEQLSDGSLVNVDGGATLQLSMIKGIPGQLGITFSRKAGGMWYSSKWENGKTVLMTTCSGEILVQTKSGELSDPIIGDPGLIEGVTAITAFPNPSSGPVTLKLILSESSNTTIDILSSTGQVVQRAWDGFVKGGQYKYVELETNLAKGLYFIQMRTGKEIKTVRLVVSNTF